MAEREGLRSGVQGQLSVRRGRAAVEFYKAAFGATELFRFGGDDTNEEIVAQLAVGDGAFWVEDESPDHHNFSPQSLGGPPSGCWFLRTVHPCCLCACRLSVSRGL